MKYGKAIMYIFLLLSVELLFLSCVSKASNKAEGLKEIPANAAMEEASNIEEALIITPISPKKQPPQKENQFPAYYVVSVERDFVFEQIDIEGVTRRGDPLTPSDGLLYVSVYVDSQAALNKLLEVEDIISINKSVKLQLF